MPPGCSRHSSHCRLNPMPPAPARVNGSDGLFAKLNAMKFMGNNGRRAKSRGVLALFCTITFPAHTQWAGYCLPPEVENIRALILERLAARRSNGQPFQRAAAPIRACGRSFISHPK